MSEHTKETTIVISGKTRRQLIDETAVLEFTEKQGMRPPEVNSCYLCKREQGEESVRTLLGSGRVQLVPIELKAYKVQVGEGTTLIYRLCDECALLLGELCATAIEPEEW